MLTPKTAMLAGDGQAKAAVHRRSTAVLLWHRSVLARQEGTAQRVRLGSSRIRFVVVLRRARRSTPSSMERLLALGRCYRALQAPHA